MKRIWASGTQTPGPRLVDTPLLVDSFAAGHQPIASQAPPTKETPLQTVSYGSGSSDGIGNYLSRTPTSAVSGYPSIGGLSQNVAYSGLPPAWTSIPPTVPVTGSASATMASAAMATPTRTSSGAPFMTPQDVQSGMPAAVQQVANTGLIDINFDGADQAGAYRGGRSPTNGDLLTAFSENIDYPTLQPAPPPCICEQYQPNGLAKSLWNQGDTISDVQAPFTYVGPLLRRVRCAVHGELPIIELRDARGPVGETIITPIIRPQAQTSRPLNALAPAFIPRKTAAYKPTQPEFTPGSASFEHVTTPSDLATTSTSPKTTTSEGPPGFQTSAAGCGLAASRWA